MVQNLTFIPWQRSHLFDLAERQGTRLTSKVPLRLTDTGTGHMADGDTSFTLMAAADIEGLKPGAIKHMAPAPFARDAETTKLVHIDFWEKDLPWRYTPQKAAGDQLAPWMVLLVGTGEEMQVKGGIVDIKDSQVLKTHNLANSYQWAHTQMAGKDEISRIVSPRGTERDGNGKTVGLRPQHEYVAVLVPAFNAEGNLMWDANGVLAFGVLRAFHFWRFWTTEAGDFETLALALRLYPAADTGKAKLRYRRVIPADAVNIDVTLEVRGAITSIQSADEPSETVALVRGDLNILNNEVPDSVGMPQYGRPWLPNPDDIDIGWPHDLNDDPRFRGTSGLGLWMGIQAQEELMNAAVQQSGALRAAGQRIGHMALGILAAGRLWDRRLPTDKNERLRILGPMMSRMIAADGGRVLDRVTSSTSPLPAAIFSSAAQRLLRDRSPQTRHLSGANGGINRAEALDEANQPEKMPERTPAGLPHYDSLAAELGLPMIEEWLGLDTAWLVEVLDEMKEIVQRASDEYGFIRNDLIQSGNEQEIPAVRTDMAMNRLVPELADRLQARLPERDMPCEGGMIINAFDGIFPGGIVEYFGRVLELESARQAFYQALWRELVHCMGRRPCAAAGIRGDMPDGRSICDHLLDSIQPPPRSDQRPINLGQLSDTLYAALDPRKPDAPARVRLCSTLRGVDCMLLTRPEYPIGLNFPTWSLLKKFKQEEWLLPGADALKKDSITALQTNPAFIDAYMMGINTQFMSEMRWRDLAVERTCTPLRMFWGQVNYAIGERQADIEPLAEWAKITNDPIGALSHQTLQPAGDDNPSGSRLIIVFRSDLFRRYPATLVYLIKPADDASVPAIDALIKDTPRLDKPVGEDEAAWRNTREYIGPSFVGDLTPEITFFAFDVTPIDLKKYWLILDEPPAELRFRNDETVTDEDGNKKLIDTTNSAKFASSTLDQPTRIAWSGAALEQMALDDGDNQ